MPLRLMDEEAGDDEPLFKRRHKVEEPDLDITPMIDMTFLLLIFFLVTSVPDVQKALALPPAHHGVAVDDRSSIVITLADVGEKLPAQIYLGDGREGEPLVGTATQQAEAIAKAVRAGIAEGKTSVLIKAERGVVHRDVARVSNAASAAGRVRLHVAVMEVE